ncbi:MAG TPA: hypothetical protein DCF45_12225 [Gammaproteobacteria bacterium]|nr:hypothetical protein [Gammaproteobacteria bacterium]
MAKELVISFLYGEFNAALVDGAQVLENWSPSSSDRSHGYHEAAFRFFLESALEHFNYRGKGREVSLIVADVEMEHHPVRLPPVKRRQLKNLLAVETNKLADGRAFVWSHLYLGTFAGGAAAAGSEHYLLHGWPASKLKRYLADFEHLGVSPRIVVPDVALLTAWLESAELNEEAVALVSESDNGTTLVLADLSRQQIFIRRLSPAIGHNKERLPGEIRRSLQYASQDIGLRPSLVITNDQQLAVDLQPQLDRGISLEIEQSWVSKPILAGYTSMLGRRDSQSLVPDEIRYARLNRLVNGVVKTGLTLVATSSVIAFLVIEWRVSSESVSLDEAESRYELRVQEQKRLLAEIQKLDSEQRFSESALYSNQPLIFWALRGLGDLLPDDLALSRLRLHATDSSGVQMKLNATTFADNLQKLDEQMHQFGNQLSTSPWMIKWPADWSDQWRKQYMSGRRGQQLNLELVGELPR